MRVFDEWDMMAGKYPVIEEIVKIMGREQESDQEIERVPISHYMPEILSPSKAHTEIDGITIGDDISLALPSEIAQMADPMAEWLFYQKYATQKLQLFSSKPPEDRVEDSFEEQQKPRPDKGPVIVCIDTSYSMQGEPTVISKAMLLQLVEMAHAENRKCLLVSFSVNAEVLDLTAVGGWAKLKDFLSHTFSGGTDGSEMLKAVFAALDSEDYKMADVLMISDFMINPPTMEERDKIRECQDNGTRFYGLEISSYDFDMFEERNSYKALIDRIWKHLISYNI